MLRHGEVYNPRKILCGRLPRFHLSELGVQMAKAVAQSLAGRDVIRLVASPLERAQQTAEPLAERFGLTVEIDERLIEGANVFEGKRVSVVDGVLRDPRNWWALRNPITPSWGEPYAAIAKRMWAALQAAGSPARGARWSACRTNCPSGPCAGFWNTSRCGTTRAGGNAPWPA
jgi:broad specificity phosphatase PhoE